MSTCQCFSLSRRFGTTIAQLKEDMWCPEPVLGFGLAEPPRYFLEGRNRYPDGVETLEAGANWAREFPRDQPLEIIIYVPEDELKSKDAAELSSALERYFNYRAEITSRDLNELFRVGRQSLLIGLTVLGICVLISRTARAVLGDGNLSRFAEESLIILGWVANWKPIEIFLYDWWPLARRRDLYRRLAQARVEVRAVRSGGSATGS